MATIQSLRKKLRGIRSTQKLSKAMKTAATVKYSRLSAAFSQYNEYESQCRELYENHGDEWVKSFKSPRENAPICFIVLGSNKGMCGSFNSELCDFAYRQISDIDNAVCFVCGKQAISFFVEKKLPLNEQFVLNDVPAYSETTPLIDRVYNGLQNGEFSAVKIIFSKYENMMNQVPQCVDLFFGEQHSSQDDSILFIPDRKTVVSQTVKTVISAIIVRRLIETSLGAQAATLMTMRSAYDTATELCTEIEAEINRKRQSRVTADVLETSVEYTEGTEV